MSAILSLRSEPPWLQQQQQTSPSLYHPLLLLPGYGGEAVQVEAALLLACSPLLRRTLPSICCCFSSDMTVILPSSTYAALKHLAQIVAQGSVTIAIEALADISSLLTLLEVDMDTHFRKTTDGKKAAMRKQEEKWKLSPNSSPRFLSPPPTPPTASRKSTSGGTTSDQSPSSTSSDPPFQNTQRKRWTKPSPAPALPLSLVLSIPLKNLSLKTVQKITATQGNLAHLSSSEVKTASSPEQEEKVLSLPRSCPKRPPVTCIFCDITMPTGTDQSLYLQHLQGSFFGVFKC